MQNETQSVRGLLLNIHRMHTETLLNPFFQADYVMSDDGQAFDVFTNFNKQIKVKDDTPKADHLDHSGSFEFTRQQSYSKNQIEQLDAVEEVLLDDFSLGEDEEELDLGALQGEEMRDSTVSNRSRGSSIDSVQSLNMIRRNRGKQLWGNLSTQCLETLAIKIDQMAFQFEQKHAQGNQ